MLLSLPALLGLGFFISEVLLAAKKRAARIKEANRADAGSLRLLWIVISCAVTAGVMLAVYGVGPRMANVLPYVSVGVTCFVLGTILRWRAIQHLGQFFTVDVAVSQDHRVVDDGPYRLVRHPSYTGLLMQFAGLALCLGNWLSLAVILLPIWFALLNRIRVEEQALHASLGEAYQRYSNGTKRLVPLIY